MILPPLVFPAEYHHAKCHLLNIIVLNTVLLSVVAAA